MAGLRTVAPVQLQTLLAGNKAALLAGHATHWEVMEMSGWNIPAGQAGGGERCKINHCTRMIENNNYTD